MRKKKTATQPEHPSFFLFEAPLCIFLGVGKKNNSMPGRRYRQARLGGCVVFVNTRGGRVIGEKGRETEGWG